MPELMPKWYDDANCIGTDSEAFFINEKNYPDEVLLAKRVCLQCKVGELCLKYALDNKIEYGIWGAHTPSERSRLKRRKGNGEI